MSLLTVSALTILASLAPQGSTCSSSKATAMAWSDTAARGSDIVDTAISAGSFKTLAAALGAADLVDTLKGEGPFTVFAPTDAAFAALPRGTVESLLKPENKGTLQAILGYHVVAGAVPASEVVKLTYATTVNGQRVDIKVSDAGVNVDGALVTKTDIRCSNGIIHVIDAVIMPSTKDIVATAVEAGSFRTLAAALEAAGLVEALQGKGPFTVFAPTDDAFAALPEGTVASLLKPENKDKLAAILTYHVVPGRVYADAAAKGAEVKSLQGGTLTTMSKDGGVYVGKAKVIRADIETSNGVIHVIDQVLLPR